MNILLVPFFSGLLLVAFLFVLSFCTVIGVKSLYYKILDFFPKRSMIKSAPTPVEQPKKTLAKKRKPIRSIEINPDGIDRIYVKKIS